MGCKEFLCGLDEIVLATFDEIVLADDDAAARLVVHVLEDVAAQWRTPDQPGRLVAPASRRGKTPPTRLVLTMASAAGAITAPVNNQLDNEAA